MLSVSLKMPRGLPVEDLQHNLTHGKDADDAPDGSQSAGGLQRGASRKPGCPHAGKPEAEQLEGDKSFCRVHSGSSPPFVEKKYLTFQGCVYHHTGVFPLYKLERPLVFSQGNGQEQAQAAVPAARHRAAGVTDFCFIVLLQELDMVTLSVTVGEENPCWPTSAQHIRGIIDQSF